MTAGPDPLDGPVREARSPFYTGPERAFVAKKNPLLQAALPLTFGLILLALSVLLTIISFHQPATPENKFEPGLNRKFISVIVPSIFGVFMILRGLFHLRKTRRVLLNSHGVQIDTILSSRIVRWNDISRITRESPSVIHTDLSLQVLELLDETGRTRAVITNSLRDFDELASELISQSTATAHKPTYEPGYNEDRRVAKETRRIRWIAWAFLFFTLAMAGGLAAGIYEEVHTRRYATEGVQIDGTVLRTWMINVTPRIEYSFQDATGRTFTREAMMYQGLDWELARIGKIVAVIYLPSAPEWNRLVSGEDAGPEFGGKFLFLTAGGLLMFSTLFVFTFLGYDLKTENGVTKLTRNGQMIKQWGLK